MRSAWLIVGITCAAATSHADHPPIEGRLAVGVRASRTAGIQDFLVGDTSSPVRGAVDGIVGVRFGRFLVGVRAGIATPLRYNSTPQADSGETVPVTFSTVYPVDLGIAAVMDTGGGVWVSAWLGATLAFIHASSPAQHVDSIAFSGDIAATSSRDHNTSLGFGIALGYDLVRTVHGRFAGFAAIDVEGIGGIPIRDDQGPIGDASNGLSCESLTLGVAYAY